MGWPALAHPRARASLIVSGLLASACGRGGSKPMTNEGAPLGMAASASLTPASSSAACRPLPLIQAVPSRPPGRPDAGVKTQGLVARLPAHAPPALVARCRSVEASRAKPARRGSLGRDDAGAEDDARCVAADGTRGAWLVEWAAARKVKEAALTFTSRPWSLVYVDAEGRILRAGGPQGAIAFLEHEWTGRTTILAVHDLDDDGLPEVLLGSERYTALEGYSDEVTAWSVHPGREPPIARYKADLAQRGWVDLDHDGRPELLLPPRAGTDTYALLHGLTAGRFSADDDVARAGLAAICPAPSPPGTKLASPRAALCAFHWGTPRDRLLAQLDATDVEVELVCKQAMREAVPSDEPPLLVGACPSDRPSVEAGRQRNLGDPCP